jgi:hypothetical protein
MDGDREDWQDRMALRGGPLMHTLARAGILASAVLGTIVMIVVAAMFASDPNEELPWGTAFIGGLIVFMPIGSVLGALVGVPFQYGARSWLRTPTEAERRAARAAEAAAALELPPHGLRDEGRWAVSYEACARSVTTYHAVVATLPEGASREWFADVGETLDGELAEALRLARLGESLEPDDDAEPGDTARRVLELLRTAETAFAETTEQAAAIALDLRDESDFVRVRAQLEILAEQAPQLRGTDV